MCILTIIKYDSVGNKLWYRNDWWTNDTGQKQIIMAKYDKNANHINNTKINTQNNTSVDILTPNIVNDISGNIYLTFYSTGNFGSPSGQYDIILMKLDQSGNILWTQQNPSLNTINNDITPQVRLDLSNNIYLCYATNGTITSGTNKGSYDVAVCKLDMSGTIIWSKQLPTTNTNIADTHNSFDVDIYGNIYVAYQTSGVITGGINSGMTDIVVFKMNTNGNVLWTKQDPLLNTTEDDFEPYIVVDVEGNSYVAYNTNGTLPGVIANGGHNIVLFKLDSTGNIIWRSQHPSYNSIDNNTHHSISVDLSQNLYLTYNKSIDDNLSFAVAKFTPTRTFNPEICVSCFPKGIICHKPCNKEYDKLIISKYKCDSKYRDSFNKFNTVLTYYNSQLTIINLLQQDICSIIQNINKFSSDISNNNNIQLIQNIQHFARKYVSDAAMNKQAKSYLNTATIFGTSVLDTGLPLQYTNGLGGITNTPLSGTFILNIDNSSENYYECAVDDDVNHVAIKIKNSVCDALTVVDGLEIGISINASNNATMLDFTLIMTIMSQEKGNKTINLHITDNTADTYLSILSQINSELYNYISSSCFDAGKKQINIKLNGGYLIKFKQLNQLPSNQFLITTYLNSLPINYGTPSLTNDRYIYGYLLIYNMKSDFTFTYPSGFISVDTVTIPSNIIIDTNKYYGENITLNLSNLIQTYLETVNTISIAENNSRENIEIKSFISYSGLLQSFVKYLHPENSLTNTWRVKNLLFVLDRYAKHLSLSANLLKSLLNTFINTTTLFYKK